MSARRSSGASPARRKVKKRPRRPSPSDVAAELVHAVLAGEGVALAEVGLAHGGDDVLRELNRRYRGKDKSTDVLSFTYEDGIDGKGHRVLMGDLVLSVPRVLAQARRYRVTPGRELARLLTHGSLHLCGHDHVKEGERRRMRARERIHMSALTTKDEDALSRLVQSWAAESD